MEPGPAKRFEVAPQDLRWRCDPERLPFASTAEVEPVYEVIGQERAVEALRFGLRTRAAGQNVFVRGLPGTGRMTLLRRLIETHRAGRPVPPDHCYVHDFAAPERPRLVTVPAGSGEALRRGVEHVLRFIRGDLPQALASDVMRERRKALETELQAEIRAVTEPFDERLRANGLALVTVTMGNVHRPAIAPIVDGHPVSPQEFAALRSSGKLSEEEAQALAARVNEFSRELEDLGARLDELRARYAERLRALLEEEARSLIERELARLRREFPQPEVAAFLDGLAADVVARMSAGDPEAAAALQRYRVNVIAAHDPEAPAAVEIEPSPTVRNLLGTIGAAGVRDGEVLADHMTIRGGALLRADGGYLVLDARDLVAEPGAWRALVRTLRSGKLEIAPPELVFPVPGLTLQPEPIPIEVKVVLVGDPAIHHLLESLDPDFSQLFKVLADFDIAIPRDEAGLRVYAGILARIAREEELRPFERGAVAAIAEHGARIAARQDRLTARFGRLADIAREAEFVAGERGADTVSADDVRRAIERGRRRADLPARRFYELIAEGVIRIETGGAVVGQINGLAVTQAGALTYGFPARITATIGPGSAGAINIEREANLSGAIHTKGFYILGGLLRHLLRTDHPLAFSASVALEQSYGGIDGDSASGAEVCCLLSALTDVALRQDLAMTGAIDQHGHIQPVGAVTEKIEGFFDACRDAGLTGDQGVIIPRANVRDLMLRPDVVEACAAGRFHVWAVETVGEALALLTGRDPGERGADGRYPDGTLLALAEERALAYWRRAAAHVPENGG